MGRHSGYLLRRYSETVANQRTSISAVQSNAFDRTVSLEEFTLTWTARRPHVCPVQSLCLFVDDNAIDITEQIAEQCSAIAAIGIHLDNFATGSVLQDVKFSGTHSVLSDSGSLDSRGTANRWILAIKLVFHHSCLGNCGSVAE